MPYCFVKGGIESYDCHVSSLSKDEARMLISEFKCSNRDIDDKHCNKASIKLHAAAEPVPFKLMKSLKIIEPANFMVNVLERKFGYRVVSAVGDDPTIWTMHRPSSAAPASNLTSQLSQGSLNLAAMAVANKEVAALKRVESRDKLLLVAVNSVGGDGGAKDTLLPSPSIQRSSSGILIPSHAPPAINVSPSSPKT